MKKGKKTAYRELKEEIGVKKKKVTKPKKVKSNVPLKFSERNFFISFYVTKLRKKVDKFNLQE